MTKAKLLGNYFSAIAVALLAYIGCFKLILELQSVFPGYDPFIMYTCLILASLLIFPQVVIPAINSIRHLGY
ncbi:MAG: hypothetical protein V4633_04225 [Pseudomonadota bacterium]